MGVFIGCIIVVWFAISGFIVPGYFAEEYIKHLECRQTHNVFACEKRVEYVPVGER